MKRKDNVNMMLTLVQLYAIVMIIMSAAFIVIHFIKNFTSDKIGLIKSILSAIFCIDAINIIAAIMVIYLAVIIKKVRDKK